MSPVSLPAASFAVPFTSLGSAPARRLVRPLVFWAAPLASSFSLPISLPTPSFKPPLSSSALPDMVDLPKHGTTHQTGAPSASAPPQPCRGRALLVQIRPLRTRWCSRRHPP